MPCNELFVLRAPVRTIPDFETIVRVGQCHMKVVGKGRLNATPQFAMDTIGVWHAVELVLSMEEIPVSNKTIPVVFELGARVRDVISDETI